MKTLILQVYDEKLLRRAHGDDEYKNIIILTGVLKKWCDLHQYSHSIHFLSDEYKLSQEFRDYTYDQATHIQINDLGNIGHAKFYSFVKALEYLQTNEYDYICILDTDVSFYSRDKSIEDYLQRINALDKDVVMGLDCVGPENYYDGKYPNGGVYLFKNTPWTKRLLYGLITANKKVNYSGCTITDTLPDQMQMSFITMICPECDHRVLITRHENNIMRFYDPGTPLNQKESINGLFFHFAGPNKIHIEKYFNDLRQEGELIDYDYRNVFKDVIYH